MNNDPSLIIIKVPLGFHSIRLDKYLADQKIQNSRSKILKLIQENFVLVNGATVKASYLVEENDQIEITIPEVKKTKLIPKNISLDIIAEDEDIIVLNKPCGLVVHPGNGHQDYTLVEALLYHCKKLPVIGGVERPGIVHRLDKGTSGVMIIAKNDQAHFKLSEQFKNHQIEKIYYALVFGTPKNQQGRIENYLMRSPHNPTKYTVSNINQGKLAISEYEVIHAEDGLSLIKIKILTGRTHQIRVHLSNLGHALVGDETYGGSLKRLNSHLMNHELKSLIKKVDHPLLHSYSLSFEHPSLGKRINFMAQFPHDFRKILEKWGFKLDLLI